MTDRLYLVAPVQDRISFILFIRPFELLRAGNSYGIVAIGTATTINRIDQIVVTVLFEPVLSFHPHTFVVSLAGQFQPVRSQLAGEKFDRPVVQSVGFPADV